MKSGDVEIQPGPQKLHILKVTATLLIAFSLLLLIGISNYNAKASENTPQRNTIITPTKITTRQSLLSLCNVLTLRNMKKKQHIKIRTTAAYLLILLLMAGDIQPNPGPNTERCLICKKPASNTLSLKCDTCSGWSHISCTDQRYNQNKLTNHSYQWQCPNPYCLPNHQEPVESTLKQTPNRYQMLPLLNSRDKMQLYKPKKENTGRLKAKCKRPTPQKDKAKLLNEDNLLGFLTKITPEDYIGKDKCKACHKTIGKNQRAISCDKCERWTHLKCSDMTTSKYKQMMSKDFPWICNTCRKPEIVEEFTDIRKLTVEEMPTTNLNFIKNSSKEDFLILHYNCRSAVNKMDEIRNICSKLNPSILCLTETWLDSSNPKTALTPEGYKIIRNDRSDIYKQKHGKNSGGGTAILHKEDIKVRTLEIGDEDQETQWIEVKGKPNFILAVVYRAQYTDLLDDKKQVMPLEVQLFKANTRNNRIIVTGDLNCDINAEVKDDETNRLEEMF